jgi:nucleoporin POM152
MNPVRDNTNACPQVADSRCPGLVDAQSSVFKVDWMDRPYAKLASETQATFDEDTGGYRLRPVCQGANSHVDLQLSGRAPWQLVYNIARDAPVAGTEIMDVQTFSSIEPRTRFQLLTAQPGKRYYELKQIGDAAYPLSTTHAQIPRASRLLFSQDVLDRPSGEFLRHTKRISYCLNDVLVSRSMQSSATLRLSGSPPFEVC